MAHSPQTDTAPTPPTPHAPHPAGFVKPAYWTDTPAPAPALPKDTDDPAGLSPTRYGDWVKDGIAVDF